MLPIYIGRPTNSFHTEICLKDINFYVVKLTYELNT